MELTQQQKDAGIDMVKRRMKNTGETWEQAVAHITNYLNGLASVLKDDERI